METLFYLLFAVNYIFLPLAYSKSVPVFIMMLIISAGVSVYKTENLEQKIFKLYIWSFSFFGVSLGGIKIFDWITILSFFFFVLVRKKVLVSRKLFLLFPFYLFVIIQCIMLGLLGDAHTSNMFIELVRYILALFTFYLFFQLRSGIIKVIGWMDFFSIIVILQAVGMFIVQRYFSLQDVKGLFTVQVFSDQSESRISAFFSDPNKMMVFFCCMLLIRIYFSFESGEKFHWSRAYYIYLVGAVISLSRTSIIIAILFLLGYFLFQVIFRSTKFLGGVIALLALVGLFVIVTYFKTPFLALVNGIFVHVLDVFGRSRTVEIDSNVTSDSRVEVWKTALPFIKNHLFFGNGLLSEESLLPIPTHNTVMQLMLDTGLIGTILYFVGVIVPIARKIPVWIVLTLLLVPMLFLDLANFRLIFVILGFILQKNEHAVRGIVK